MRELPSEYQNNWSNVVVSNDAVAVMFPSDVLAVDELVSLVTQEAIQGFDDRLKRLW
jgi:hypothetical protein